MPLIRNNSGAPDASKAGDAADLFAALKTGAADARWSAARALATAPGGVEALGQALAIEGDARVREAIFTALSRAATPASAAIVAPCIRSDDADVRTAAIDALKAMPRAAGTILGDLLNDPDADVRLLSCEVARSVRSPEVVAQLCALLEQEREANVCGAAVEVLAEIGDGSAAAALAQCAARFPDEPFLGFAIRAAADQLGINLPPLRG